MKPARGRHGSPAYLSDDRRKAAAAKSLLHDGKRLIVSPALGIDQAAGRKSGLRQCRCEQVVPGHHPQYLVACTLSARSDPRGEQGRRRIVVETGAASSRFMEGRRCQPAASKPLVHRSNAEGQAAAFAASDRGFNRPHLGSHGIEA